MLSTRGRHRGFQYDRLARRAMAMAFPNSLDPNEECPACRGTGVAHKNILEAVLKKRRA